MSRLASPAIMMLVGTPKSVRVSTSLKLFSHCLGVLLSFLLATSEQITLLLAYPSAYLVSPTQLLGWLLVVSSTPYSSALIACTSELAFDQKSLSSTPCVPVCQVRRSKHGEVISLNAGTSACRLQDRMRSSHFAAICLGVLLTGAIFGLISSREGLRHLTPAEFVLPATGTLCMLLHHGKQRLMIEC